MREFLKDKILGTWKLISWQYMNEHQEMVDFFGTTPSGILMYDRSGYMNAQITKGGRQNFQSESLTGGTEREVMHAFHSYAAYYGRYYEHIPGEIVHVVEGSLFPNWVGHEEVRYGELQGGHLILSTPPIRTHDKEIKFIVTWERV